MILETPLTVGLGASIGAVLGSFISTAALRRIGGVSIVTGRSRCDGCQRPLGHGEMIPALSFALNNGRCRTCNAPISPWHLAAELVGAATAALTVTIDGPLVAAVLTTLVLTLLWIAIIDAHTQRIPNVAVILTAALCVALPFIDPRRSASPKIALGLGLGLLLVGWTYKRVRGRTGVGLGDIKLLSALALGMTALDTALGITIAAGLALAWLGITGRLRAGLAARVAFAPFIALAFGPIYLFGGW